MFTLWPFTENVCQPLLDISVPMSCFCQWERVAAAAVTPGPEPAPHSQPGLPPQGHAGPGESCSSVTLAPKAPDPVLAVVLNRSAHLSALQFLHNQNFLKAFNIK